MGLGKECGAVTGAFMVIGLSIRQEKDEKDARLKAYDLVKKFKNRFEAAHGTILCKDGRKLALPVYHQDELSKIFG